jgi:RHH-type transcriptional regulator, rel operon repressor / antitoxin RelB
VTRIAARVPLAISLRCITMLYVCLEGGSMLAVRLTKEIERRLERLARDTRRSKSYYVKKAIEEFLEDREDYLLALARLEEDGSRIPLEKVIRQLGLED